MIKILSKRAKIFFSSKVVRGAFGLCLCVLICKILGVVYRIPLTNILTVEGVGIYQLIFPVYSMLLIFSSNAVPVALSKIVSLYVSEDKFAEIAKLKKIAFLFFGIIGTIFTALLIVFSRELSMLQGNYDAHLGYVFIAPSIFLVCLISVYRGVFQGYKIMYPTGVSQIVEQGIKLLLGLILPFYFSSFGVVFQVEMSLLGVTISELIALMYLMFLFHFNKKIKIRYNFDNKLTQSSYKIFTNMIRTITPIMLANCIMPICVVVESFTMINVLVLSGLKMNFATEVYGVYSGIVCVLYNAPIMLASSIGMVLVPYVSSKDDRDFDRKKIVDENCRNESVEKNDFSQVSQKLNQSLFFSLFIIIPSFLFFLFGSRLIVAILYPRVSPILQNISSVLLSICSVNVISLSLSHIYSSFLQSQNAFKEPLICFAVFNFVRLVLALSSLYFFGISAFAFVSVTIYALQAICMIALSNGKFKKRKMGVGT